MASPSKSLSQFDPTPLLLAQDLPRDEVFRLLAPYGLHDVEKADANLQSMAGDPRSRQLLARILPDILQSISQTADPDQALNEWERYLEAGNARAQVFSFLANAPHLLQLLCVLFGNSPAMAETVIRDPMVIYWMEDQRLLKSRPTKKRLQVMLHEALSVVTSGDRKLEILRRFHRREMLRIGARDLFRVAKVQETFQSLSQLAETVIHAAYHLVKTELESQHGVPHHTNSTGKSHQTRFTILGMGKLGGGELNYSSDVDLVYIYESSHGHTKANDGQSSISNEAYFQTLARKLTQVLSQSTSEGSLFRVDLRLRPEGDIGPMAWSLDEAVNYYQTRGRPWERLAFLKARPIAGEIAIGKTFLAKIHPFVIGQEPNATSSIVEAVRALRTQIHQKVNRKGENDRNVKLSPGGIRDIEFIVQTLQLLHVAVEPQLFEPNNLKGLQRLIEFHHVSPEQGTQLKKYYLYLRDIEHKLQMVHELQTHTLPNQESELFKCAVRMGHRHQALKDDPLRLLSEYRAIAHQVQELFHAILF
jgi:[glutamine synthetase] adenylyltransferase / [glutamine synthetase]-adenylyl-L-tyrosine phosphorylase